VHDYLFDTSRVQPMPSRFSHVSNIKGIFASSLHGQ